MKATLYLFLLALILGCAPKDDASNLVKVSGDDILLWDDKDLPISVSVDENFTTQEKTHINDAANLWESAADKDFFTDFITITPNTFDKAIDYYSKDPKMGIYKINHEIEEIDSQIIALTQLYIKYSGERNGSKVFKITHFDIFINDNIFDFNDGGGTGFYDFKTVLLHEFGHVVGISDHLVGTLMNGSLASDDVLTSIDSNIQTDIHDLYHKDSEGLFTSLSLSVANISGLSSSSALVTLAIKKN